MPPSGMQPRPWEELSPDSSLGNKAAWKPPSRANGGSGPQESQALMQNREGVATPSSHM